MDNKRLFGKMEEERMEYDALCGGYEGDELMQINVSDSKNLCLTRELPNTYLLVFIYLD